MQHAQFLRRKEAASYLRNKFGFGSVRTLAKGVVTGDSPVYQKASRMVLYTPEALDTWALSKIGAPQKSSSDSPVKIDEPQKSSPEATANRHRSTSEYHAA